MYYFTKYQVDLIILLYYYSISKNILHKKRNIFRLAIYSYFYVIFSCFFQYVQIKVNKIYTKKKITVINSFDI